MFGRKKTHPVEMLRQHCLSIEQLNERLEAEVRLLAERQCAERRREQIDKDGANTSKERCCRRCRVMFKPVAGIHCRGPMFDGQPGDAMHLLAYPQGLDYCSHCMPELTRAYELLVWACNEGMLDDLEAAKKAKEKEKDE